MAIAVPFFILAALEVQVERVDIAVRCSPCRRALCIKSESGPAVRAVLAAFCPGRILQVLQANQASLAQIRQSKILPGPFFCDLLEGKQAVAARVVCVVFHRKTVVQMARLDLVI
jgi:hypothetical protein